MRWRIIIISSALPPHEGGGLREPLSSFISSLKQTEYVALHSAASHQLYSLKESLISKLEDFFFFPKRFLLFLSKSWGSPPPAADAADWIYLADHNNMSFSKYLTPQNKASAFSTKVDAPSHMTGKKPPSKPKMKRGN